jgi:hypothetical protein
MEELFTIAVSLGEIVRNRGFSQLFCYPKFFKNKKKKLTDFGNFFG